MISRTTVRATLAALALAALTLTGCTTAPEPESAPPAEPVTYPVPDGCPTAEDFGYALMGDKEWVDSFSASDLGDDLSTPLLPGACAYSKPEVGTTESGSDYRIVQVWYFRVDEPGTVTTADLQNWAATASGVTDEDGDGFSLPIEFSGYTTSNLSISDDEDGAWGWVYDHNIPEFVTATSARIQFGLDAPRVDALVAAAEAGTTAPNTMTGIIAANDNDDSLTLTALDPVTGAPSRERRFVFPADVRPAMNTSNAILARQALDPTLSRLAAVKKFASDGSTHVGWITKNGSFVDVTEVIVDPGEFDSTVRHSAPAFGTDGSFYYLDNHNVQRIGADQVSDTIGPVQVELVLEGADSSAFFVWPTGTIDPCAGTCVPKIEYQAPGVYGLGNRVTDWLDDNTVICGDADDDQIWLWAPYTPSARQESGRWACGAEDTERKLLPDTDRKSWNSVASPDGQTIAFLSSTGAGDSAPQLFTVKRDGSGLGAVETGYAFTRTSSGWFGNSNRIQILDWR